MVFVFGIIHYQLKDSLQGPRNTFGFTFAVARGSALVLHVDVAMILFPVCRTLISLARQTPLNGIIQFDKNITFHKMTAWSIVFFSWLHTIAHWNNFAQIAAKNDLGFVGFLVANLATGPGWSGYVMLVALMAMVATSVEKARRANFERFWYTHHLFIIFFLFWSIHGAFCMIKPDFAPFCVAIGSSAVGVFWQYWMYGGYIYLMERIAREIRGKHKTYLEGRPAPKQCLRDSDQEGTYKDESRTVHLLLLPGGVIMAVSSFHTHQRARGGLHLHSHPYGGRLHQSCRQSTWM